MYSGSNDFYGTRIITNNFEDGFNLEFMKNSSFFPFFSIRSIDESIFKNETDIDIFNGKPSSFNINIEKLAKYIKFQMTIKHKH